MPSVAPTKGERTRQRILSAAAEHFAVVGFDAGSVPEIARRVGVSHATLYQHFGRKEELFRAAVEADLTGVFDAVFADLEEAVLDADAVVALVPELVAASRTHPLARRVLGDLDAEMVDALRDLPALTALQARLTTAVERSQAAGRLRDDRPADLLAAGLISVTLPMLVVALRLDGTADIPRAGDALRFLADAVRATPHPRRTTRANRPTP